MEQRWIVISVAVLLIAVGTTSGHEGHLNQTQAENSTIVANNTEPKVRNSSPTDQNDDYEWHNTDDYPGDGLDESEVSDNSNQISEQSKNETVPNVISLKNETEPTTNENSSDAQNLEEIPQKNVTNSEESQEQPSENTSNSNLTSKPEAENNNDGSNQVAETMLSPEPPSNGEEAKGSTTEDGTITSTLSKDEEQPSGIVTQDIGDSYTNYTNPVDPVNSEYDQGQGYKAWSVAVVSILVSFAVIFTILYFIRGALIRKRRMDQRKLLRGSVSSEGYFYGDGGEPTIASKFEF
ncbi:hypothetical protein Ocin01_11432 [Orchesella cincta]|uniref:Uncharacterized protein n=1 Tax=Orchesella cincta TaxID=48709 RepID=A0A1D2MQW2_ORCCI|nr:hypothetical protein Ocin01_11432 [Orchesella cincta]